MNANKNHLLRVRRPEKKHIFFMRDYDIDNETMINYLNDISVVWMVNENSRIIGFVK